jgi:hypothetical protein
LAGFWKNSRKTSGQDDPSHTEKRQPEDWAADWPKLSLYHRYGSQSDADKTRRK